MSWTKARSDLAPEIPRPPCVAEIHIPGLIYVRIERCPRWLPHLVTAGCATVGGWVLAHHPWLLTR
jgi:hypothetical protein